MTCLPAAWRVSIDDWGVLKRSKSYICTGRVREPTGWSRTHCHDVPTAGFHQVLLGAAADELMKLIASKDALRREGMIGQALKMFVKESIGLWWKAIVRSASAEEDNVMW